MNIRLISGLVLVIISTLCYNLPSYVIDYSDHSVSEIPVVYYSFYNLFIALNLLLVSAYALFLFVYTDSKHYKVKIIFLWLFIAETSTFLDHTLRKYLFIAPGSNVQIILTLIVFIICCSWFLSRALHNHKTDIFNKNKTYIIRFKPSNIFGIFNYIINRSGHKAIYQDGKIYKFRKRSGKVEEKQTSDKTIEQMILKNRISLEKIDVVPDINKLIGIKYRFLKYNCNHLIKDARK